MLERIRHRLTRWDAVGLADKTTWAALLFLCLFIVSLPFSGVGLDFMQVETTAIWSYTHLFLGAAVALSAATLLFRRPKINALHLLIIAFAATVTFSGYFIGPDKSVALTYSLGFIRGLCVFFVLSVMPTSRDNLRTVIFALAVAAIGAMILVFFQEIHFAIYQLDPFMRRGRPLAYAIRNVFPDWLLLTRAVAMQRDPNYFGIFLGISLASLLWLVRHRSKRLWILVGLAATLVVFLTFSRGAWLSIAATACFYAFIELIRRYRAGRPVHWPYRHILTALFLVLVGVSVFYIRQPVSSKAIVDMAASNNTSVLSETISGIVAANKSVMLREVNAQSAWQVFVAYPIYGVGLGGSTIWDLRGAVPHNFFLEITTSTGTVGLLIWLGIICLLGWQVFRMFRADESFAGLSFVWLSLIIFSGVSLNLLTNLTFWLVIGLVDYCCRVSLVPQSKIEAA